MSHIYCPECGFQNPEAARYCAKCGALLVPEQGDEATEQFSPEDAAELFDTLDDVGVGEVALVVRSGGGRSGETFTPQDEPTTIGRSPECEIDSSSPAAGPPATGLACCAPQRGQVASSSTAPGAIPTRRPSAVRAMRRAVAKRARSSSLRSAA